MQSQPASAPAIEYNKDELSKQSAETRKRMETFRQIFSEREKWQLHSKKWQRLHCKSIFQFITGIGAQHLELYNNCQPQILCHLWRVSLSKLTHLNLKNNKIVSIDVLSNIRMEAIVSINLADNHVSRVVPALFRAHMPTLRALALYANNVVEGWQHPRARTFVIGSHQDGMSRTLVLGVNYMTDFRWVNKLEHVASFSLISIENNRSREYHGIDHWAVDTQNVLL